MEVNPEILAARAKLLGKMGKGGAAIGGKGTQRRKVKAKHTAAVPDDKKLQAQLKRLGVNQIPGIEEVNMFKEDQTVISFKDPKVQANIAANTYVISGANESKPLSDMGPGILGQMGQFSAENMMKLLKLGEELKKKDGKDDEEIPDVDTFDTIEKKDDSQEVD